MSQLLTPQALAANWHVTPRAITALARRGDLRGVRIGTKWRFTPEAVAAYLERETAPAEQTAPIQIGTIPRNPRAKERSA